MQTLYIGRDLRKRARCRSVRTFASCARWGMFDRCVHCAILDISIEYVTHIQFVIFSSFSLDIMASFVIANSNGEPLRFILRPLCSSAPQPLQDDRQPPFNASVAAQHPLVFANTPHHTLFRLADEIHSAGGHPGWSKEARYTRMVVRDVQPDIAHTTPQHVALHDHHPVSSSTDSLAPADPHAPARSPWSNGHMSSGRTDISLLPMQARWTRTVCR